MPGRSQADRQLAGLPGIPGVGAQPRRGVGVKQDLNGRALRFPG